ncbi:hypothetical protein C8R44DRAFT_921151, partial [Mycena epipterygia]
LASTCCCEPLPSPPLLQRPGRRRRPPPPPQLGVPCFCAVHGLAPFSSVDGSLLLPVLAPFWGMPILLFSSFLLLAACTDFYFLEPFPAVLDVKWLANLGMMCEAAERAETDDFGPQDSMRLRAEMPICTGRGEACGTTHPRCSGADRVGRPLRVVAVAASTSPSPFFVISLPHAASSAHHPRRMHPSSTYLVHRPRPIGAASSYLLPSSTSHLRCATSFPNSARIPSCSMSRMPRCKSARSKHQALKPTGWVQQVKIKVDVPFPSLPSPSIPIVRVWPRVVRRVIFRGVRRPNPSPRSASPPPLPPSGKIMALTDNSLLADHASHRRGHRHVESGGGFGDRITASHVK